jgi:hypothetical protein
MGGHVESLLHDGVVRESKLLWTLGNYSRFVRPGMVRVQCAVEPHQSPVDGLLASAYRSGEGETVIVLTNLSAQEAQCDLGSAKAANVYTTWVGGNLKRSTQCSSNITIPARAVATVCLDLRP